MFETCKFAIGALYLLIQGFCSKMLQIRLEVTPVKWYGYIYIYIYIISRYTVYSKIYDIMWYLPHSALINPFLFI